MSGYQAGISKFEGADTQVFGVSTDNTPSQGEFAKKLNLSFPLLSDFATRKTAEAYAVLMPERGYANRATFVVDKEGKITNLEQVTRALGLRARFQRGDAWWRAGSQARRGDAPCAVRPSRVGASAAEARVDRRGAGQRHFQSQSGSRRDLRRAGPRVASRWVCLRRRIDSGAPTSGE